MNQHRVQKNTQEVGRELEQRSQRAGQLLLPPLTSRDAFRTGLNSRGTQVVGELSFLLERCQKESFAQRARRGWRSSTVERSQPPPRPGPPVIMVRRCWGCWRYGELA